ncbi:hypothetical protein HYW17_05375 [Candidatus Uhrbacteria bacterium]|nr:hypothetical protein [Candidatus Uhrbacteria bacterium]
MRYLGKILLFLVKVVGWLFLVALLLAMCIFMGGQELLRKLWGTVMGSRRKGTSPHGTPRVSASYQSARSTPTSALASLRVSTPDERGIRILARAIYRELRSNGYDQQTVVGLAAELITLVQEDLRERASAKPASS